MHELHLAENILKNVLAGAGRNSRSIVGINIVWGKDSTVDYENLKFLLEIKCRGTIADGARINVKETEGKNVFVESIDVD